mgnify:CR=1 FL=1
MIRIDITSCSIGEGKTELAERLQDWLHDQGYVTFLNHDNQHSSCKMRDLICEDNSMSDEKLVLITDGGRYGDDDRDLEELQ